MRLLHLLTIFLISLPLQAESFDTVLTSIFKTEDGRPTTVKASAAYPGRGHLILFWAGWCVPCKEELKLVAQNQEKLQEWNITAVNVDDSAGRLRADGILKSFDWRFNSLYDEAGSLFFQINSSGELPLALAFDGNGNLIEIIRELKEPAIEKLQNLAKTIGATKHWEISEELHYVQRKRSGGTSDVGVNTLAVKYNSENWQAGAGHNLIRQKQDPRAGWKRFEDEVGLTYAQYQWKDGLNRARLGDETIEWGKGALLSARAIPGTEINSSVLGAHLNFAWQDWSIQIAAGKVRQQLFGLQLDPAVDLTQDSPDEDVWGFISTKNFLFEKDYRAKLTVGNAAYHRDALTTSSTTSYLTPHDDDRFHAGLAFGRKHWGLDVAQTYYTINESKTPGLKESRATQIDGFVHSLPDSSLQLDATYLEKQDTLPRVFTPVLTEYPALPLTTDSVRSWRLAPRAILGKWIYEPLWIGEESYSKTDFEKQNTWGVSVLRPETQFKTVLLYQKHGNNALDVDSDHKAGVITSEFSEILSGQVEFKEYEAVGRNGNTSSDQKGRSAAAQLSVKIEKLVKKSELGQLLLSVTRTHQDGYFFSTSGISEKQLMGYRLTWTLASFELRAAAGQEPGGLVCSGGVCAQRPPLDGFAVEGKMRWQF